MSSTVSDNYNRRHCIYHLADAVSIPLQWSGVADVHLEGKDAGKFESLKARMGNEQREYLKQLRSKAFADRHRYTYCYPEAAHQIQVLILTFFWLPVMCLLSVMCSSSAILAFTSIPISDTTCLAVDVAVTSSCMHA